MLRDPLVWIVGVGPLSVEYWKILAQLDAGMIAIGRGANSAMRFAEATGQAVHEGGLTKFIASKPALPSCAIVATSVEALAATTLELLQYGVRRILVEKPGAMTFEELAAVKQFAQSAGAIISIGYNRRLFASTRRAKTMMAADGGVQSFNFEFTEWSDRVLATTKSAGVLDRWVLANSSHVIDLAFHLGGEPDLIECLTVAGLDWHPAASIFAGAGQTKDKVLFSYSANWQAPGRWGAEFNTSNYRFVFRPLEKLQIVRKDSVQLEPIELDDELDTRFKPGLFLQTQKLLQGDHGGLCSIDEHLSRWPIYEKIAGYDRTGPLTLPPISPRS